MAVMRNLPSSVGHGVRKVESKFWCFSKGRDGGVRGGCRVCADGIGSRRLEQGLVDIISQYTDNTEGQLHKEFPLE